MTIQAHDSGGMTITGDHIYLFSMMALIRACELKAKHGIGPRGLPSVKRIRAKYGIKARSYAEAAEQLAGLVPEPGDEEGLARLVKLMKGESG